MIFNFFKSKDTQKQDSDYKPFIFGNYEFSIPVGFNELNRSKDMIILKSIKDEQQITVSGMLMSLNVSHEDFKKICDKRINAERHDSSVYFINPSEPFKNGDTYTMFFSGGDKKSRRIFSGYLSLTKGELITAYLEGLDISPEQHFNQFKKVVNCLKYK